MKQAWQMLDSDKAHVPTPESHWSECRNVRHFARSGPEDVVSKLKACNDHPRNTRARVRLTRRFPFWRNRHEHWS